MADIKEVKTVAFKFLTPEDAAKVAGTENIGRAFGKRMPSENTLKHVKELQETGATFVFKGEKNPSSSLYQTIKGQTGVLLVSRRDKKNGKEGRLWYYSKKETLTQTDNGGGIKGALNSLTA